MTPVVIRLSLVENGSTCTKAMKDCESGKYVVLFQHKSRTVTAKMLNEIRPMIEKVENLFLQSYNDVLKLTNGRFTFPVEEGTVEEIAKITSPLSSDRSVLKMSFELRGMKEWRSGDSWTPYKLGKFLGYTEETDPYARYKDARLDENGLPDDFCWFTHDACEAYGVSEDE